MAQVDAGKVLIRQKEIDIVALLQDVAKEQQATYAMRHQQLAVMQNSSEATAYVDPDKIRMVLENMIDNASKYSDPGKSISVNVSSDEGMVRVDIVDQGVGIAPEDIDRLFEKFNRIHNHLSNHVGGTGLGLYWAKKIIDLHGGIIKVVSVLGEGSTFSVFLPKIDQVAASSEDGGDRR